MLEHHVHRSFVGWHVQDGLALDLDVTRGRFLEARNHPHDRGFPAARRPENGKERARRDIETDVIHGPDRPVVFGQVLAS